MQNPALQAGYRDDLYTCVHQVAGAFASVTDGSQASADSLRLYLPATRSIQGRDIYSRWIDKPQEFIGGRVTRR